MFANYPKKKTVFVCDYQELPTKPGDLDSRTKIIY